MEEEIENLDSENEEIPDIEDDIEEVDEEKEELKKKLAEVEEANKQLYARIKKDKEPKEKSKVSDEDILRVLEKRELDELDLNDDIKTEVEKIAKLKGVSIKKALNDPYIVFQKEQFEAKQRAEEASLGSKGRPAMKKDYSAQSPADFDLSTEEGRKEYAKYEEHIRKELG